jgi:hydroxymethylpyrimidine pyrophosphatase-like HAD family hydrolase
MLLVINEPEKFKLKFFEKIKNNNMKNLTYLFLAAMLLLLAACDTKKAQEDDGNYNNVQFDAPFKMTQKKGVKFENDDLKIIFNNVSEDSRCPEGTTCTWEGQVKVNLTIKTKNSSKQVEILRKGKQKENAIQQIGEHTIYLMAVNPYPKDGEKIAQEDYKITMVVK